MQQAYMRLDSVQQLQQTLVAGAGGGWRWGRGTGAEPGPGPERLGLWALGLGSGGFLGAGRVPCSGNRLCMGPVRFIITLSGGHEFEAQPAPVACPAEVL